MQNPSDKDEIRKSGRNKISFIAWQDIRSPGLTAGAREINRLLQQLPKQWAVHSYKHAIELIWIVFVGGTGTGKSTIYNAFCEKSLSETGVERPKTFGPIVYAHRQAPVQNDFPLQSMSIELQSSDEDTPSPHAGTPEKLLVLQHERKDFARAALVDTPDLDSLELRNHEIVEDLYLLADVVVFVTSEEKYADDVPFQFLRRVHQDGKICFLLLNKAGDLLTSHEVLSSFQQQGVGIPRKQFRALPYLPPRPEERLRENGEFKAFAAALAEHFSEANVAIVVQNENTRRLRRLKEQTGLLVDLLVKEKQSAENWLDQLESLSRSVCHDLLAHQERHFDEESRDYLQEEIRKLFSKYDLLGRPRRFIGQLMLAPLRLLGWPARPRAGSHQEALQRIRERINLTPVHAAMERFNRSVLEDLSPADEGSPLYRMLRRPELRMTDQEVKSRLWEEQDKLITWLEATFQEMAEGIPKSKEWGIYSTSILWGSLILSFEAAIGGGISLLEAALDSALAPFLTKGAVELFAYQELQKIARELARRYQDGVLSVLRLQKDRYREALQSLMTPQETMKGLEILRLSLSDAE